MLHSEQGGRKMVFEAKKYKVFRNACFDYISQSGPSTTQELMYNLTGKVNPRHMPQSNNSAGQVLKRDKRFSKIEGKSYYLTSGQNANALYWGIADEK